MIISVFDKVENIVGKGENAGYQHFFLFPQCILKRLLSQKVSFCGKWVDHKDMLLNPVMKYTYRWPFRSWDENLQKY